MTDQIPTVGSIPTNIVQLAALIDRVETEHGGCSTEETALYDDLVKQEGAGRAYSLWVHAGRMVDAARDYGNATESR